MQDPNKSEINIIGGTYTESCFEPGWDQIYGSGFRAVNIILDLDSSQQIIYHTCCDDKIKLHLRYFEKLYPRLKLQLTPISINPTFHYDHPLDTPIIFPRPDLYNATNIRLQATGGNILAYGLLEASININGKKVVYDPQSPVNPKSFLSTGSKAEELIIIVNLSEAKIISGSDDLSNIVKYFFKEENCFAVIIKMGALGALLYSEGGESKVKIPIFKTDHIWPIGSGDVFSASFAYNWFIGENLINSSLNASKATAIYCNTKDLSVSNGLGSFTFNKLIIKEVPKGQIYLAGPFFTFSERWMVNEAWKSLMSFGLKVFSPYHKIGFGKAQDVVEKDLIGLDSSEIVFAIIDGLDSGTLFEVGYAISQKKKVIAFVQNEDEESLKMLYGTNCIIEKDFTTAIYKTYWNLASK